MRKVILIHGAGNDNRVWKSAYDYLNGFCDVYTPNLPGHGGEGAGLNSIEEYSNWIVEYILSKNLNDVVLLGHSMGGAIAIKAAKSKRVAGLVIADSGLKLPVSHKIIDGLKFDFEKTVKMIAKWLFSKNATEDLRKSAVEMMINNQDAILKDFLACDAYNGVEDAKSINIPSFVMVGEYDVMTPLELAENAASYLDTNIEIIDNSGHMTQMENPRLFYKKVEEFLNRLD